MPIPEPAVQFALVLIRITTFFVVSPVFNRRNIPSTTTIGFSALLALIVLPNLNPSRLPVLSVGTLLVLTLHEVAVGLLLGLLVLIAFGILQFAGQLTDVPIGFGMASVFDPATGMQMPVFSQFYYILAVLLFFAIDGHLWLVQALTESYATIPLLGFIDVEITFNTVMSLAQELFHIGMKISLPVIATILLVDIGLGIVVRAVPQINVFVIGFPIKIFVGMLIIALAVPAYVAGVSRIFAYDGLLMTYLRTILQAGGG